MQQSYKKLILYQKTKELVLLTYKLTRQFPKEELYVLIPQMRRAAISVLANLVEGYIKKSHKEYARFIDISIGSITELEVFYELSLDLKYINNINLNKAIKLILEIKKLLYTYQKTLRAKS